MRTSNYLWAVLVTVALSLAACAGDENENELQPKERTAKVELILTGTPAETKATGTLPTSEVTINRVTVGIFNSDGTTNTIAEPTLENKKYTFNCMPGTCDIIVVANAPTGTFTGVTTKSAFIAKTVILSQTATSDVQNASNLPMSGKAEKVTLTAGKETTQTISLSRLVARICINNIKTAFDSKGQYSKATFSLKKVFLHNAMSTSQVTPEAAPTTTLPLSGSVDANNKYLQTALTTAASIGTSANTTNYWFYTFANTNATKTKLVLFGSFDPDGTTGATAATDVYYPVVINKKQPGTTITGGTDAQKGTSTVLRNTLYNITATIKGKGVDSPDKDIEPATLVLTVEVAAWALTITQDVTFE